MLSWEYAGAAANVLSECVYTRHTLAFSDPSTRAETDVQASEVDLMHHWCAQP